MPMFPIPTRSLRLKLVILAAISAGVAVLLACLSFIRNDLQLMRHAKVRQLDAQADLLGLASGPALADRDRAAAQRLLDELIDHPSIDAAALYDRDGKKLAEFLRTGQPPCSPEASKSIGSAYVNLDQLEHAGTIAFSGGPIGTLYLRANMDDINQQLRDYRFIVIWVVSCSMLVATALSFVLQRRISRPILDLAEAADKVTEQGDYSIRVASHNEDAIGHLFEAFNHMLDRIEVSDRALKAAHDELEQRVEHRTAELMKEIVERRKIEEDLVRAKESAEKANRAKSEFLANMSHEIRTPLNAILGFADLMRRNAEISAKERREYLETIHRSGEHLLSLINDVLDLSKIEAGQLHVEQIRCSPARILAETISLLRVRAKEKGLSLEYRWSGPVPEAIISDPARLRQILFNVIGNAIKFTERGGVQVVAQIVSGDESETARLVIDVIDTGVGIAPDKLSQIFEPFYQADTSVTRRFGGTGLGLTICQRLARALGGGVSVQSRVHEGSVFTIAVDAGPLSEIKLLEGPTGDISPHKPVVDADERVSLAGSRILVADDGDSNRKLIQIVLERAGAKVTTASHGREAVDAALDGEFDVILMDMQMPVMDGYGAAQALRERQVTTPIIALTAHAMKGDREKCMAAGCTDYLTKPIEPTQLVAAVACWLAAPQQEAKARDDESTRRTALGGPLVSSLPMSDPDFREIVEEFVDRFREKLAQMHAAAGSQNYQQLQALAHWLRGAGGTAGFKILSTVATRLQEAITGGDDAGVRGALAELEGLSGRILLPVG
jgi:signal transduction histidine kinase/AmiR/NasT family two-component response regulator